MRRRNRQEVKCGELLRCALKAMRELNKDGGTVVFGVTRKGKLTGQLMADTTKRDLFDAFQKFEPAADIEVSYVPVDETHTAIVCHVDGGNRKPYIYDGKPHKRVQSSPTIMSQEEYERMLLARVVSGANGKINRIRNCRSMTSTWTPFGLRRERRGVSADWMKASILKMPPCCSTISSCGGMASC